MYAIGTQHKQTFLIDTNVINQFAGFSQDYNPIHMDVQFAKNHGYPRQVSHGIIQLAYLSKIIGMDFPGPGAIWMQQSINWLLPVLEGDKIEIVLTVKAYSNSAKILTITIEILNQKNKQVMTGEAMVKITNNLSSNINPTKPIEIPKTPLENQEKITNPATPVIHKPLGKKVALITGASRGIGAEIAKQFGKAGYTVIVNYQSQQKLANSVVEQIIIAGGEAIAVQADISNGDDVKRMSSLILNQLERCDIIVHGASPPLKIIAVNKTDYSDIELYLNIYLKGAVSLVRSFSDSMIQNKFGRFVFIGTSFLYGQTPYGMTAYVSAKESLWGYTKALATEMAHYGITTNMVSPSLTITDLTTDVPARIKEVEAMKSPIRRLVNTNDIALQVVHLCSDSASYINGINLPITSYPI